MNGNGEEGRAKSNIIFLMYLCKVNYVTNKFIHIPALSYNKVICLLELAGVAEQA
jgi:hypothetical protein